MLSTAESAEFRVDSTAEPGVNPIWRADRAETTDVHTSGQLTYRPKPTWVWARYDSATEGFCPSLTQEPPWIRLDVQRSQTLHHVVQHVCVFVGEDFQAQAMKYFSLLLSRWIISQSDSSWYTELCFPCLWPSSQSPQITQLFCALCASHHFSPRSTVAALWSPWWKFWHRESERRHFICGTLVIILFMQHSRKLRYFPQITSVLPYAVSN